MSAKRHTPTAAQRTAAAERRARMQALAHKIATLSPEARLAMFQSHPIVSIEGKPLSMYNTVFVMMQDERATVVGGFQQWRRAGRVVRKREHGLSIWFPRTSKQDENKQEDEISGEDLEVKFMLGTVFDVAQTDEATKEEVSA